MTDVNLIATLIFFVSALSCIILANYLSYRMLREANSALPDNKTTRTSWLDREKHRDKQRDRDLKLTRRNRRLYRLGILRVGFRSLLIMAIASTLACAWELGFLHFFGTK